MKGGNEVSEANGITLSPIGERLRNAIIARKTGAVNRETDRGIGRRIFPVSRLDIFYKKHIIYSNG